MIRVLLDRASIPLFLMVGCLLVVFSVPVDALAKEPTTSSGEKPEDRSPAGLAGVELEELESDFDPTPRRFILPPYYQETKGPLTLRLFFPLFFYRSRVGEGARTDFGVLPFYWRHRSKDESADVYFPFYWRFRGPAFKTDIVLQTYYNRSDHGYNWGVGPFVFVGKDTRDGSSYQVVPPFVWRFVNDNSSFLLAGIYYDRRKGQNFNLGLPPLLFAGRERYKTYQVVLPPLFWRFTDDLAYTTNTVVPPFFYNTREQGYSFGLFPLLYVARDKNWDRTLIAPFLYFSRWQQKDKQGEPLGEGRSYYFPLLLSYYRHGPELNQGGIAFFYHWYWYRGDYLKMYSPFVWTFGNDRTDDNRLLIPPFYYHRESPLRRDRMLGLIYWDFHEHHRERTVAVAPLFVHNWNLYESHWRTWILPTFDFGKQPNGYHARMHPFFYLGREGKSKHLVLAPLLWKFKDEEDDDIVLFPFYWRFKALEYDNLSRVVFPFWWQFDSKRKEKYNRIAFPIYWDLNNQRDGERTTVIMPLFWRDRDKRSTMTGVLNVVWHEGEVKGNPFWTFRFAPFFGFGHPPSPEGAYWSVLGGLVGWRRQGRTKEFRLFWIPFDLSD